MAECMIPARRATEQRFVCVSCEIRRVDDLGALVRELLPSSHCVGWRSRSCDCLNQSINQATKQPSNLGLRAITFIPQEARQELCVSLQVGSKHDIQVLVDLSRLLGVKVLKHKRVVQQTSILLDRASQPVRQFNPQSSILVPRDSIG